MIEAFQDQHRDTSSKGLVALLAFWCRAIRDAVVLGLAERWSSGRRGRGGERRRPPAAQQFLSDLRHGVRLFVRDRGLTTTAVVALALGIGLTTTAFSIVYGAVYRGLPFERPDELIHFEREAPLENRNMAVSYHDYRDWRRLQTSFVDLGAFVESVIHLTGTEGLPQRLVGVRISAAALRLLQVRPALGRSIDESDERLDAPDVIVLSDGVWRSVFGADSGVVGRQILANGAPTTVVGVMPPRFGFPIAEQFWIPLRIDVDAVPRGQGRLDVFGRLRPGETLETARAEFATLASALAAEYPENRGIVATLKTFQVEYVGEDFMRILYGMFASATLVLILACANVANLLLARATRRRKEMAVRTALGAGRGRIASQLFTEVFVIATVGAVAGLAIAHAALSWFDGSWVRTGAMPLPHGPDALFWWDFRIDLVPTLFVIAVTLGATVLAGLAPAIRVSRMDVSPALNDEGRSGSSRRGVGMSRALVVAEIALTTGLLVAAGLTVKSVAETNQVGAGIDADAVVTARVGLPDRRAGIPDAQYSDQSARLRFWEELMRRLQDRPGVISATVARALPVSAGASARFGLEGDLPLDDDAYPRARVVVASPDYLEAFGVTPVTGRFFNRSDAAGSEPVAVVNESFARRYFADENPLFRRLRLGRSDSQDPWLTIVGVVPDLWVDGERNRDREGIYLPLSQSLASDPALRLGFWGLTFMSVAVRVEGDASTSADVIGEAVAEIDPRLPVYGVQPMRDVIDGRTARYRMYGMFYVFFGGVALFLAVVGLYGVMSFAVGNRRPEIGIRMALGAGRGRIVREVLTNGIAQLGIGLTLGVGFALWLTRGLDRILFNVEPGDTGVFGIVIGLIVATGIAACLIPARRAAAVDPLEAVRGE